MDYRIILLCFLFIINNLEAQHSFENNLGSWFMLDGNHQISNQWYLKSSAHFRYYNLTSDYQQEIYRLGFNYHFSNKTNITIGSVYSITDNSFEREAPQLYEFRFYQDLNMKSKWNIFNITHRFRLAQRFTTQNAIQNTIHRIRYGLFLSLPIYKKISLYGFNEIFMQFRSNSFDQNRTGIGMIHTFTKNVSFRLGYFHTKFSNYNLDRLQIGAIINTTSNKKHIKRT